ncbi:hypothetical protein FSP39_002274 [Pinctada imbricata]|uniref:Importin-13 n=1 Tax=Pinctada imbricata TaxID=66713 RepID=A0AA89C082_PINIB|nr:hypothetical protein FSP39_002274 [Pinctada imbricata]
MRCQSAATNPTQAMLDFQIHKISGSAVLPEHGCIPAADTPVVDCGTGFKGSMDIRLADSKGDVPEEQYDSLRTQLLQKLVEFCGGSRIVLTRLCVALSSLILNMSGEHWEDPIQTLITTFQNQNIPNVTDAQKCHVLLETLRVLPEESLMVPSSPPDIYQWSLKCFSSWVEFGVALDEAMPAILQVFQAVRSQQLFDTAVETLVNVFSHPDSNRYIKTAEKLLPHVLDLREVFQQGLDVQDVDICQGVGQIVVALAENHTKLLLDLTISTEESSRVNAHGLIQMVLACSSLPGHYPVDENFSNLTFTFWYLLQDEITESESEKRSLLIPIFRPVFFSLVEALLIKVQYPDDEEYNTWSAEEKEMFRCYRQDIGDTMMYAFGILGKTMLSHLSTILSGAVDNVKTDVRWQVVEGLFFLFGSIAECVDLEYNAYIPAMMNLLPKLPFNNVKFISSALYLIGSYSEWINCHPECLRCVVPLVLQGLGDSEIATSATLSLKDLTRENLDHIRPYIPQILSSSQSRDCSRLMSSVGQVLSVIDLEEILQYLNTILTPHIQQLQVLIKQEPTATVKNNILVKLMMLGSLFAALDTERDMGGEESESCEVKTKDNTGKPKPVMVILQQVLPLIQELVAKWISDCGIVEAVCEMYKHALKTLLDDFSPVSQNVCPMLGQMYQTVPHPAILDLAKQLIIMHSDDKEMNDTIKSLLGNLCEKTLQLYQAPQGLQNYTDVIEGFMNLLSQVLKKCKRLLASESSSIPGLYHAAVAALCLPEHQTVKATCSFLTEFSSAGGEIPAIKQVIENEGHLLVDRVIRAIGGESPRGVTECLSDVLLSLGKMYTDSMVRWLNEMVHRDGYPSPRVSTQDKEMFVKFVIRERNNKRKSREIVKEFSLKCRGLYGTEYAAQALKMI